MQDTMPPESTPPVQPPPAQTPPPANNDNTMGMLCHLLGLLGFIGPLIIWLIKKDESQTVNTFGKESLNFQLSMLIYSAVIGIPTCGIGLIATGAFTVIMVIIASLKANKGEFYRYPLTIRFIK
jgi:uncharacterized Tic20 family protein